MRCLPHVHRWRRGPAPTLQPALAQAPPGPTGPGPTSGRNGVLPSALPEYASGPLPRAPMLPVAGGATQGPTAAAMLDADVEALLLSSLNLQLSHAGVAGHPAVAGFQPQVRRGRSTWRQQPYQPHVLGGWDGAC
jgi:hypothetical protein